MARSLFPVLLVVALVAPRVAAADLHVDAGVNDDAGVHAPLGDAGEVATDAPDAMTESDAARPPPPALLSPPTMAPLPVASGGLATVILRGRVIEKGTRRPLAAASIGIDGASVGETGADGSFQVWVTPGPHHVQVRRSADESIDRWVDAEATTPEGLYRLPLVLTDERYQTVVRAGRRELPPVAVSGEEARKVAGSSGDPLRVLGSLPGVSQVAWPAALYVVRGANPGNTGFFVDGVRIPALFHLALGPSIIHPYLVGGLEFYPGGYPANLSGYVSGIMAARTVPPPADRVHASADVTLYDAGGIVTSPWDGGRGTVAAAARYSYTGALFSLLASDTVLRYGDYQLRVDHPLAGGQATVLWLGSIDELGWLGSTAKKEYASFQFHRLDARWQRPVAGGRLLAGVTLGADRSQSTLFARPIKMRALSAAPRIVYSRSFAAVDVEMGADANAQDFAADVPDFQRRGSDLSRSRPAWSQGLYATVAVRVGRRLTVAPGIRGEAFFEQGVRRLIAEPRLAVVYQVSPTIALKGDGGRFAQMPSLPVSVPGFEAFGLADLGLQTSLGGSLGVDARLLRNFSFGLTGYYQRLRVTDVRDLNLGSVDPAAPDFLVSRRGHAFGAELLVRRADQGRFFGWLAYTLSWSLREDDGGILGRSDWDQRHILNLVAGQRLGGGYALGARFHYNSGRYAPIIGGDGTHRQLPVFYDLDLRGERRFVFDRFLLDAYIDLGNVTLTRQVVQLMAEYSTASTQPAVVEEKFRIILPTIGVHAEF